MGSAWAQQAARPAMAPARTPIVEITAETATGEAAQVIALDKKIGEAIVSGDVAFWNSVTAPDFEMTHGAGWTNGGKPTLQDTKQSFGERIKNQQYKAYELGPVKIEIHATTALVYGRYIANIPASGTRPANMAWFSCWYEHLFEKQNGKWMYVSHRTVFGPIYGATKAEVQDK